MKIKFITINKYKNLIIIIYILLLFISTITILEITSKDKKIIVQTVKKENVSINTEEKLPKIKTKVKLKEYENMPQKIDGYKVIGKLEIPKIELQTYVLDKTTEDSLNKSVTKLVRTRNKQRREFLHNRP